MVSYSVYYSQTNRDFSEWYQKWWKKNCEGCEHSSHHNPNIDNGHCYAEKDLMILSRKVRKQQYIAIDYHKHDKGTVCFLKKNIITEEVEKNE